MKTIETTIENNLSLEYHDNKGNGLLKIRPYNNSLIFIYYEYKEKKVSYFYDLKLNFAKENYKYFLAVQNLEDFLNSIGSILSTIKLEKKPDLINIYFDAPLYGKIETIKLGLNKINTDNIPTIIRLSEAEDLLEKKDNEIKELKERMKIIENNNIDLNAKINNLEKNNIELETKISNLENIINSRVPIFRLRNKNSGDHFYCSTEEEKNCASNSYGYIPEGIEFYAFPKK